MGDHEPDPAWAKLVVEPRAEQVPGEDPSAPKVGRWYWVKPKSDPEEERELERDPELACIVYVGSNYAKVQFVNEGRTERVHLDEFWQRCEFVAEPEPYIRFRIELHKRNVHELMDRVKELTARLAITPGHSLSSSNESAETQALALHTGQPLNDYKAALVLAEEKTLPALFEEIKEENASLSLWLRANLIPLEAEAAALKPAITSIKKRIFSVQLYAGLVEDVEQIADGEPATMTEPVHLIQRRAYMDEECLAQYEAGGMEFKDLSAFDRWLARPSNRYRLLPFPRCIMAFQVRRDRKHRLYGDVLEFFRMIEDEKDDKLTFLYIRNGEQLFRLSTKMDFDAKLFPDMERPLEGNVYARMFGGFGSIDGLISENEYKGIVEEEARREREQDWGVHRGGSPRRPPRIRSSSDYVAFTRESVYYDDIAKHIFSKAEKHNNLVLILQGLLDRSPVLHPHPPWLLWTAEGFGQALRLVYDDSRALSDGEKPDFEAYRASLNARIRVGSVTIGQQAAWKQFEARKGRERHPGNPGPGKLAHVARYSKRSGQCTYEWARARAKDYWREDAPEEIACSFTTQLTNLLNVDAYKPGDFKKFFSDPRTRAEYLCWAPLLLEAEEYHAGNREVAPVKPLPKRRKTEDGSYLYHKRKTHKAMVGKAVRLRRTVTTQAGKEYSGGSLWRVVSCLKFLFDLHGITADGREEEAEHPEDFRCILCVSMTDIEVDPTIPAEVKEKGRRRGIVQVVHDLEDASGDEGPSE